MCPEAGLSVPRRACLSRGGMSSNETPLVQREAAQGQAPHTSKIYDAFISQLPQAHHLSDRGSQVVTDGKAARAAGNLDQLLHSKLKGSFSAFLKVHSLVNNCCV